MFPNHINSAFHTPPNSTVRLSSHSTTDRNSDNFSLCNAVAGALAMQLLNQSGESSTMFSGTSGYDDEQLSCGSMGSFSLAGSPAEEHVSPISPPIRTPRPPTRLMEPIPISTALSEGEQRSELRAELFHWVSGAASALETAERGDAAVDIISCFRNKLPTLSIKGESITELPSCIGLLGHVLAINLSNCRSLRSLPNVMHNFSNLHYLILINCESLTALPPTATALPGFSCFFLNGSGVDLANPLQSQLTRRT